MIDKKIGIIGCGNMGEAILAGLSAVLEKSTKIMVSELDASRRDYLMSKYHIIVEIDNNYLVKNSDVIIIAVKPKDIESLLKEEICCSVVKDKLIISIAAGVSTGYIEGIVGKDIPVVRMMPNLPALIGKGITSMSKGRAVGPEGVKVAREIFSLIGEVVEVDEKYVDAVTAVSGSGPAYCFYIAESIVEAAEEMGLPPDVAKQLVVKMMLGSAAILESGADAPATLRQKVTSKGGTTEAALEVLNAKSFKDVLKEAVKRACARSKEMSKG